jgi:hypothetical protein
MVVDMAQWAASTGLAEICLIHRRNPEGTQDPKTSHPLLDNPLILMVGTQGFEPWTR